MSVLRAEAGICELLDELEAKSLKLWFEGRQLRFHGPRNVLTPEHRQRIAEARSDVLSELRRRAAARNQLVALSPVQQRILQDETEGRSWPVHSLAVCSDDAFDFDALRQALQAVVDRHAMLRLRITVKDGAPIQLINGYVAAEPARQAEDAAVDAAELRKLVDAQQALPFEHGSEPPWRMILFGSASVGQVLLFSVHPVAVDTASFEQLVEELRQFYAEATGAPCRLPVRGEAEYLESLVGDGVDRPVIAPASSLRSSAVPVAISPDYCTWQDDVPAPVWHEITRRARHMQLPAGAWLVAAWTRVWQRDGAGGPVNSSVSLPGARCGRFAQTVGPFSDTVIMPGDCFGADVALDEAAHVVARLLSRDTRAVPMHSEATYRLELRDAEGISPDVDRFIYEDDPGRVLGFGRLSLRPWVLGSTAPRPRLSLQITHSEAKAGCRWIGEKPTYTLDLLMRLADIFRSVFDAPSAQRPSPTVSAEAAARASASDLLERLRKSGARLWLEQDRLRVNAPKGVLDEATKAELARQRDFLLELVRGEENVVSAMVRVDRSTDMPMSHTQQRIWFLNQMDPSGSVYNIPAALRLSGSVNLEALQKSLNDLVARHESLRSRFRLVDGIPYCVIEPHASVVLEQMDLTAVAQIEREAVALRAADDFVRRPFDLTSPPLLRTLLIRTGDDLHVFAFALHHVIADGLSINVFLSELRALYKHHACDARLQLPELSRQFVDYIEWERRAFARGALDEHAAFWKRQLADLPSLLQLPTDRPRPTVQTTRGARAAIELSPDLASQLTSLARNRGATLFMVLLAALEVLLHRYSGETDIAVGSVIANRNRIEMENVIGFFANTIVLRGDLSGNPTVSALLARVRDVALNAYAHQDMPFDMLVDTLSTRRALGHSALFQVLLVLQKFALAEFDMGNLHCEAVERPGVTARFDISVDVFELPQGLRVYFEYNTDLFDATTIERMMQHYGRLLAEFVSRPEANIDQLEMLTPGEQQRMLVEWNNTAVANAERTVHGLFEEQAARNGDAVAVRFEDTQINYAELNASANRLAHYLHSLGIGRDSLVGICLERSTDMVVAVLGVLKAGAAYVPLDPAFPKDRIDFMAADAKLEAVIIQTGLVAVEMRRSRAVSLDGDAALIANQPSDNPAPLTDPHGLAYVIYTSGSTGLPKGVMITHGSIVNFLRSMQREPGIAAADRFVAVTTLSFDIAGLEIFGPLTSGGTIVLASRVVALDGAALAELLDRSEATLLQATPATWRLLIESEWQGRAGLKMLCGGEGLPRDLAEKLLSLGGELWNLYGPTETTIWSTISRVTEVDRPISIGRPIANTQVYVLEPGGHPAPIGVVGELFIGGDGVARGYLNRQEITAEKFITLDLPLLGATRVYRTGDMARFLADGSLDFVGRRDHQVKVRGFRIELGEIETILAAHPGVKQNVVHVREDSPGDQRLVAYVVPTSSEAFDTDAARATLRNHLPEYMIPNMFAILDSLPLTPNGKVNRGALPAPAATMETRAPIDDAVMTPVQREVAAVWKSVLKLDRVALHENFFDLGGHSLLLVRLQSGLQREFGRELPLVELFQCTTVAAQAERLAAVPRSSDGALKRAQARAAKQAQLDG